MNGTTGPSTTRHEEQTVFVDAFPEEVFAFADDHAQFSAHMGSPSWMMLGSRMDTSVDAARGQEVGSHITMTGNVVGIPLVVDEVVVEHVAPWERHGKRSEPLASWSLVPIAWASRF